MLGNMTRPVSGATGGSGLVDSVILCHACDLAHGRSSATPAKARIRCVRCRAELFRTHSASIDTPIALACTALVLLILSNAYPLAALQLNGNKEITTLVGAAFGLYRQGYMPVAALVLVTTVLIPLFQISTLLYVLISLRMKRPVPGRNELFRALTWMRPWAMSEVFLLGALVAIVKLAGMAQVVPGIALFSYGALMLTLTALTSATPNEQFWQWAEGSRA
jgi:paraquat-inducible protein A